MKNLIQLVTSRDIDNTIIRCAVEAQYRDDLMSSDNYVRYYPDDDSYDIANGFTKLFNNWLEENGFTTKGEDEYFHLLIRIDW